jgi:hypothetical protein
MPDPKAHEISIAVTGKIGDQVYQRVRKGLGNIETQGRYDLQLRAHAPQTDARTPAQLRTRARIAAATRAYQALSDAERLVYKRKANRLHATGYNLFVREFCRAHPVEEF